MEKKAVGLIIAPRWGRSPSRTAKVQRENVMSAQANYHGEKQAASLDSIRAKLRPGQQWFWTNRQTPHNIARLPRRVQIKSVDLASYAVLVDAQAAPLHPNLFVDGTYSLVPNSDIGLGDPYQIYYRQMFAVSVSQPEAWALVTGFKPLLNSTYVPPPEVLARKRIWIHASNDVIQSELAEFIKMGLPGLPNQNDFVRGGLIGSVAIERVVNYHPGQWFRGPMAWILSGPIVLPKPFLCKAQKRPWVPELYRGQETIPV